MQFAHAWRQGEWEVFIDFVEGLPSSEPAWELTIGKDGEDVTCRRYRHAADAAIDVINHRTGDARWDLYAGALLPPLDLNRWDLDAD